MGIAIFVVVLVVLIVVHELGHFVVAKLSSMRVDEFGLGYPPHALTITTIGETRYTLNWLPFGGFVKIHGENGLETDAVTNPRAFSQRPRALQALVLVAGVAMNLLLAYVLFVAVLMMGTVRPLNESEVPLATNVQLSVLDTVPGSPSALAGLQSGDVLESAADARGRWQSTDAASFTQFIRDSGGEPVTLSILRANALVTATVTPTTGLVSENLEQYAVGVEVATTGTASLPFLKAVTDGARITWSATTGTAAGLAHFFYGIFTFSANLSQVSGPIGIAGAVGTASTEGFGTLLTLVAIISINLALINLIPIPALDGGRLLFVAVESVIRRPIAPRVSQSANALGLIFLILLMVVVTAHDLWRIFS